ncbi:MAG: 50S ribosomal protein L25 [Planctomycetota bacterium]|jgi:large subunit ribosomal protein L25
MKILNLPVQSRDKLGSANARRYRRAGQVPCSLYGRGQENVNLVADAHDLQEVLKTHSALVRLKLGEKEQTALLRSVEWDVFGEAVEHVDLVRVQLEDEVKIKVPVHCIGIPAGTSEGGQLQVAKPDLEVFSRVDSIPTDIRIDVSALHITDAVYIRDLEFPPHVRPVHEEDELVVHLMAPRKAEELEVAPLEGEEAEAAAAAEGEKPAEDAPADDAGSS